MKKLSKKVLGNMKRGSGIKTYVVMVALFFVLAILSYANIIPWFVKYILLGIFALYLLKGYFEMHKNDEDLLDQNQTKTDERQMYQFAFFLSLLSCIITVSLFDYMEHSQIEEENYMSGGK